MPPFPFWVDTINWVTIYNIAEVPGESFVMYTDWLRNSKWQRFYTQLFAMVIEGGYESYVMGALVEASLHHYFMIGLLLREIQRLQFPDSEAADKKILAGWLRAATKPLTSLVENNNDG